MITEDYVSFETAKLLKEKGYCNMSTVFYKENGELIHYNVPLNNKGISGVLGVFYEAPTLQMAMKWLRKIHNIIIVPTQYHKYTKKVCDEFYYGCLIFKLNTDCPLSNDNFLNKKYEKSCEAGIKYCLENLV